jgi:hypothetical protein
MTSPQSFSTLSEFLLQAGTEYFIIDVSRTRHLLDNQVFFDYENNKAPYANPRQGHAWLCIVFWNKQLNQEHYIWFVKLPVDEQGLLVQAAINQFLQIVTQALGQQLQGMDEKNAELPENPFVFTPSQQLLSDCNSTIRKHLNLPERPGLQKALSYLKAPSVQPWDELSLQDMSDLALQIDSAPVQQAFVQNLEILPKAVCLCLFSTFEGLQLPVQVEQSMLSYHARCEAALAPMVLRALASTRTEQVNNYIRQLVANKDALDIETLIVIAGRHWQALSPETLMSEEQSPQDYLRLYFEKLAAADNSYALFQGVFTDMVQLPSLRVFLLAMIRSDIKDANLKEAVQSFLSSATRQTSSPDSKGQQA